MYNNNSNNNYNNRPNSHSFGCPEFASQKWLRTDVKRPDELTLILWQSSKSFYIGRHR